MYSALKRIAFRRFKKAETQLHELNYLFWECTTRCNLNCIHCGSDCSKDSSHPDMHLEDFLKALDTIKKPSRRFIVAITGGEPLVRKDLEICGREIRKRGMSWGMVSNGHLYTPERHQTLLAAGMGSLTISLDGLEESHNWLRNSHDSFSKVDHAIGLAAGFKRLNFDVVTCVNNKNIGELPRIYDYLVAKGVKAWRLFTIIPIGRAASNPELNLSNGAFKEMMDFIREGRKTGPLDIKFSCEGFVGEYESKVRSAPYFCRAGINIGSILIEGSISACPNIDRSFIQGNIYQDNLYKVWQSRFTPFRDRSWTQKGPCLNCKDYKDCVGNGFHNWQGDMDAPLVCHSSKLRNDNKKTASIETVP